METQPHAASGKPEGISLTDSLRDYIHSTTLRSGFFVDEGYGRSLTACILAVKEQEQVEIEDSGGPFGYNCYICIGILGGLGCIGSTTQNTWMNIA